MQTADIKNKTSFKCKLAGVLKISPPPMVPKRVPAMRSNAFLFVVATYGCITISVVNGIQ